MATRTPVYFDGTDIVDMTSDQLEKVYNYAKYLYSLDPSVTLSYVASGGNIGSITDNRKISTTTYTNITTYPTSTSSSAYSSINNPFGATVSFSRINQNRTALSLA